MRKFVAVLILLSFVCAAGIAQESAKPEKVIPAINEIELWQEVGQQPYEFTWTQREEDPHTLVDFEDLQGWNLELYDGAQGELRRSREQQLWGEYVAKIAYSGVREQSRVIARPPQPIPIPGVFDSVELWGYGNRWSWVPDPTTPPAEVALLVQDARDKEFRIQLTDIQWKQWWLIHRRIPREVLNQIVLPARLTGIEISKATNAQARSFFCDNLAFYKEELKPLTFQPQPKRNLRPYRGQIVGTNTGPGTLPFPTREETILPANFEKNFKVTAREVSPRHFEFRYEGRDTTVVYDYRPEKGTLAELTVRVGSAAAFKPLMGGGVRFVDTPANAVAEGELASANLLDGVVHASFRMGSRRVEYELQLWQKSLVLDVWCEGGEATELSFGEVSGVSHPRMVAVPYITYQETNPRVLISGDGASPVFSSVWFDWYRSSASEPYYSKTPKVTGDTAEINGGMRYLPKTDGSRNNLYERIFISNSPDYEETLPTIANPPSVQQAQGKQVVWTVKEPESFVKDHERCARIRSYGLDKVMQHSHEVTWRDEGDSNTMKLHAAPQKGGDAMLKWYIQAQNNMGWLQGVYTNYCDFATVNTNWTPDHVQRTPEGEWRRAWPRNYALKPAKAVEFDDYYAQRIEEKFGVKMSYTDVHTAVAPWNYCDFDARVPGAGTFAATFYAYGQLLRNDQHVYGPTQSEGSYQWLYAGLTSGSYGWVYTKVNLLTEPLDVSFMLRKIHPLECDYGLGDTGYYLGEIDKDWATSPKKREYLDLLLASAIAYGNMGWLATDFDPNGTFNVEAMARSYYMMQQLQQQYAFAEPKAIEYADRAGKFQTPSQALASGANREGRLHVVYENGTEVYVNRATAGVWSVRDASDTLHELPPSGWLAFNNQRHFLEVSATLAAHRFDYVQAPEFEFLDGRGQWTESGNLGASGSVALRHTAPGLLELIDIYGNERIDFRASIATSVVAYDAEGKNLGKVELTEPRPDWYEFKPVAGGRRYVCAAGQ
ncbi:exported hypothetical protein [Acidobacteriia bacterium SbA2]|nr:exported hypothetical protein [Acidobacteriia bacterium SbA2]